MAPPRSISRESPETAAPRSAKNEGSTSVELEGGGLAVYDAKAPANVHVAYRGEPYQVELFSPEQGLALRLVTNGKIRPVPPAP